MKTIETVIMGKARALVAKAKGKLAVANDKAAIVNDAEALTMALVRALAEAQNRKTLRELREQVEDNMVVVRGEHDVPSILNILRELDMCPLADGINQMLTSITRIMHCRRNAEMCEHFQYFTARKGEVFHLISQLVRHATGDYHDY